MNSIIEAQQTLLEEQLKEVEKCKVSGEVDGIMVTGLNYFYLNYYLIDGKPPVNKVEDREFFKFWKQSTEKGFKDIRISNRRRKPYL